MARLKADNLELGGQDSFVDVVTNLVGVLIILVVVIGLRSKPAPADVAVSAELASELDDLQRHSGALEGDMQRLIAKINSVRQEHNVRAAERQHLAFLIAVAEKELGERRNRLSVEQQAQVDLRQQFVAAQSEVERQQQEVARAESKNAAVQVLSFPTPLSKTVFGTEVHFQVAEGRVAYIPIEELFELARAETRTNMSQLGNLTEQIFTVGPKLGFELQFSIEIAVDPRQSQMAVRSGEWQVIPVQRPLGETIEEALADNSQFRNTLSRYRPQDTTLTLWSYPESFAAYRKLNAELHAIGYSTAARPLPAGFPIGGSPRGSKSAAQ